MSEPTVWTADRDGEWGQAPTIAGAVAAYVEEQAIDGLPIAEEVTVYGFVPGELPSVRQIAERIYELVSEHHNSEYGPSELDQCPTALQKVDELAEAIKQEYPVYWIEPTGKAVTVRVADYLEIPRSGDTIRIRRQSCIDSFG